MPSFFDHGVGLLEDRSGFCSECRLRLCGLSGHCSEHIEDGAATSEECNDLLVVLLGAGTHDISMRPKHLTYKCVGWIADPDDPGTHSPLPLGGTR